MPETSIEIDPQSLKEAVNALVILSRPVDFRALSRDLYLLAQADVDERFNSAPPVRSGGVVYGGAVWPALSEPYLESNPRREGGQILRDTGELDNSFQIGDSFNVAQAEPDRVVFGTALEKARYLQRDRPMLFIHNELADQVVDAIALKVAQSIDS